MSMAKFSAGCAAVWPWLGFDVFPETLIRAVGLDTATRYLIFPLIMRYSWLILFPIALLPSGCSVFIAAAGSDLGELKTKEQVHEKFGEPIASGIDKDGEIFEEFRSRRKFRDPMSYEMYVMSFGMTLGLSELLAFPRELYIVGRGALVGQGVRFTYDGTGAVSSACVGGRSPVGNYKELVDQVYREHKAILDERGQKAQESRLDFNENLPGPFIRSAPGVGQQSAPGVKLE